MLMAVIYDDAYNTLRISIKQARNLAIADRKRNITNPNRGEIHVWIKSAKGLNASTDGMAPQKDNVDPYVKIYMLPGKEKYSKQKTKVVINHGWMQ
ncbi:synaptotagmin-like protein [Schistosoma mansoni]|uniref:synaptotagmin-like protein n=1 Tax=Schistosoma mansoni TaxID=6183 RepID=UPI00022DBFD5|nr:synaptotagmin-like protein [Schistosoma mansoni]|eukprot:XP_018654018.1 synaptotagmin-like protein [Schistosoma mansoni]